MTIKALRLLAMGKGGLSLRGSHRGGLGWTSLSLTHTVLSQWAGPPSIGLASCNYSGQDSGAKKMTLFLQASEYV